jgi:hypothetical protein
VEPPSKFFRGTESPRFLLLLGIVALGWPVAIIMATRPRAPEVVQRADEAKIAPPEDSIEFRAIEDRTRLSFKENAAYAELLKRARTTSPAKLAAESARHVMFSQLFSRPARFRGVLVHVDGNALRVMVHDELNHELVPNGVIYEAWVVTSDSQKNPLVLVFENPPMGFPVGDKLYERVTFDGYFLKLLAYQAGDVMRSAPMLVGRLHWLREPQVEERNWSQDFMYWMFGALTLLTLFAVIRMWPSAGGPSHSLPSLATRPSEEISPKDLTRWLNESEAEDAGDETEKNGHDTRD